MQGQAFVSRLCGDCNTHQRVLLEGREWRLAEEACGGTKLAAAHQVLDLPQPAAAGDDV